MINIATILIGIIILFAILVLLRNSLPAKICALCGAVSITWIILLRLFYLGYEIDRTFIGILMGGSVVGIMYLLERKLPSRYQIFKLPFFLTLIYLSYFIVLRGKIIKDVVIIISLVWLFMLVIYASRDLKNLKMVEEKIIKCCKDW